MTATAPQPAAPAVVEQSRWRRVAAPAATIGGLALAVAALHRRDPHASGSWGYCPSAALGFSCPGCGGLRAVNDLTDGQIGAAASSNLLFIVLLPFLVAALGAWALARWRGTSPTWPSRLPAGARRTIVWAGVALVVLFTVLRNLPAGSWLAP
ncbi:DUF2752 domain-containing protein [Nocardioides sp. SR21]|uniref:DUF2752 domain-containing protein n=1 Tax=Nocardioides sp. SR21 TaxID=2919501 RepID=UPI001FA95E31|nr:DUF2752 domain-containing protein [Nocardioides sp. SR21]